MHLDLGSPHCNFSVNEERRTPETAAEKPDEHCKFSVNEEDRRRLAHRQSYVGTRLWEPYYYGTWGNRG